MKIKVIMDKQEYEEVEDFLSTVFKYDDSINGLMPFMMTPLKDIADNIIGCEIYINDDCIDFLVGYDHECSIGSGDGCDYCNMLDLLGILPD